MKSSLKLLSGNSQSYQLLLICLLFYLEILALYTVILRMPFFVCFCFLGFVFVF